MPTVTTIPFGPLRISYDERVLTPRPWTQGQSLWAAELIARSAPGPVLELCCGAGHIGLLAIATTPRPLVCVDVNPAACELTRQNAEEAGLGHLVEVREGRLEEVVAPEERFSVVIADPPWVPHDEVGRFPEDPVEAIDGGPDGLGLARACAAVAADHLVPGGSALLQIGTRAQAERLGAELAEDGRLRAGQVREFARGVVLRLVRV